MKIRNLFLVTAALLCLIGIIRFPPSAGRKTRSVPAPTEVAAVPLTAAAAEVMGDTWTNMSRSEQATHLEQLGYFPEYAGQNDWSLAASTSWWGRRLNAKEFWGTNVVWLDSNAMHRAQIHGRQFPPIPEEWQDRWKEVSDRDIVSEDVGIDSLVIRSVYSERERVFWDDFFITMPKPPDNIGNYLDQLSVHFMNMARTSRRRIYQVLVPETPQELAEGFWRRDSELGFPRELYDAEVLRLTYLANVHDRYKRLSQEGNDAKKTTAWLKSLYVDSDAVVNGLNQEQRNAMNSWKVSYLRRLSGSDHFEVYLPAYLKAWNIDSNELRSATR